MTDYRYWLDSAGIDRTKRIASVVHRELSSILQNKVADPRIESITITEVLVSKDLKHATVFTVGGGSSTSLDNTIEALNHAKVYLRHQLAKQTHLKYVPRITFQVDLAPERGARVLNLIEHVSKSAK